MKFLCLKCDEQMHLKGTEGSGESSVAISFICQRCGSSVAMLTNPMETQLVRSLGVHVGGRDVPYKPMEVIKDSLAAKEDVSKDTLIWDKDAENRLNNIPPFARDMAKRGIERYAREKGYNEVTTKVMDEVRTAYGM